MDKLFTSDYCSAVAERDHAECCVRHDWAYWQGGTRTQRREADRAFRACLKQTVSKRDRIRWLGVRLFGAGWIPMPWRWGYGWKWPRWKAPDPDRSPISAESQRALYEATLANARASDEKARAARQGA